MFDITNLNRMSLFAADVVVVLWVCTEGCKFEFLVYGLFLFCLASLKVIMHLL